MLLDAGGRSDYTLMVQGRPAARDRCSRLGDASMDAPTRAAAPTNLFAPSVSVTMPIAARTRVNTHDSTITERPHSCTRQLVLDSRARPDRTMHTVAGDICGIAEAINSVCTPNTTDGLASMSSFPAAQREVAVVPVVKDPLQDLPHDLKHHCSKATSGARRKMTHISDRSGSPCCAKSRHLHRIAAVNLPEATSHIC